MREDYKEQEPKEDYYSEVAEKVRKIIDGWPQWKRDVMIEESKDIERYYRDMFDYD